MQFAAYMKQRKPIYLQLMRWDKPVGSLLLLWPTLTALWLASDGLPAFMLLVIFILGVFVMRAAGCVINDIADRRFDGCVVRTQQRPLASKELPTWEALLLFIALLFLALCLVLLLPSACFMVAVCALGLAVLYPWTKRWMPYPQIVLGFAFNAGIVMAYVAVQHTIPWSGWLLYSIAILWTFGYDTIYAMVDQVDDEKIGLQSSALSLGDQLIPVMSMVYLCVFLLLLLLGVMTALSNGYFLGVVCCGFIFLCQMIWIRKQDPKHCFQAFLVNQWAWLVVFISMATSFLT